MSYQVIARKYRPQRFAEVVGQEHVTQTLANAIRSGRIAHAYLFCGPRGTGKTTIARIFAMALNATGGPSADFDLDDPRCREIAEGRSLDVLEIDGASNNGVEQVRELRDTARFAPAASTYKIYIIDEVHMLTTAAFNALLKTLEEPPAHVKFLFATTDPERVLPTILSRCQRFDLRRIPATLIVRHLQSIAEAEGVTIATPALQAIARGADGGMRDAESTLDQLISFCGDRIEESDVLSMFGLAARGQILALARAVLESNPAAALTELNELARNGKDLSRLLHDLLQHFRNLMIAQVTHGDLSLLEVTESEALELAGQTSTASQDAVTRILDILTSAERRLRDAVARKIFFEVTLLKAIEARNAVNLDLVLQHLQQLRHEAAPAAPQPPTPPSSPAAPTAAPVAANPSHPASRPSVDTPAAAPARAPAPAPPIPAPTSSAPSAPAQEGIPDDPVSLWTRLVAAASPMARAALQSGHPLHIERGVLSVGYPPAHDHQRTLVDQERTRKALEARLSALGAPLTLRFIRLPDDPAADPATPSPAPTPPPASTPRTPPPAASSTAAPARRRPAPTDKVAPIKIDPVEFKNDPLIKEALELFKGELVIPDTPAPE
ncbi:MAG: DNA polymerase III subunit gamma/tau [Verrucomicrobiae bacterium]|nr:DNA polymerase III subunit gamma/tau [Verrucomicrobiae bacterium]